MPRSEQRAFTLVELAVVVVILGILAALAIPRLLSTTTKARLAEFKPGLKSLFTLEEAYLADKGRYASPSAAGSANPDLGFLPPEGAFFQYAVLQPAVSASGQLGIPLGTATSGSARSLRLSDGSTLAPGTLTACIDGEGLLYATGSTLARDAGLADSAVLPCR